MIRRLQLRIVNALPVGFQTYPMDAVFAILGTLSGAGTLARLLTSQSLEAALPAWALYVWAAILFVGSVSWLIGILSTRRNGHGEVIIDRVPILVLGLGLISVVTLVYGVAVISRGGWSGVLASIAYLAVAGGTYVRRWVIMNRLEGDHE